MPWGRERVTEGLGPRGAAGAFVSTPLPKGFGVSAAGGGMSKVFGTVLAALMF